MPKNKKPMGGAKTPGMACRKVCDVNGPPSGHQQGVFCGYATSLAGCATLCANITCPEDVVPTGFTSGGNSSAGGGGGSMRKATGTSFKRPRKGGTGQHVAWKNQSGTILGYTPMQVIIAVGVGVGAYFLYKKYK